MQRSAWMAALLFSSLTCLNAQTAARVTHLVADWERRGRAVPIEQAPDKLTKGACDERQRLLVAVVAACDLLQPAPCAKLRLADF